MITSISHATESREWIDARLSSCRLVSESVRSAPAQISDGESKQVRLTTTTKTEFKLGLNSTDAPTELLIEIDYSVNLKVEETGSEVADYTAKHAGQFTIASSVAIGNWEKPTADALAPYFAVLQIVALRRAEATLLEISVKGVTLVNPLNPKSTGIAISAEAAGSAAIPAPAAPSITSS